MSTHELPELRIALAMRGGVSLAVWMGGACSEVDSLRRSLGAGPDGGSSAAGGVGDLYRELVEAAGYGSVVVDVVAGASAGGLNAALMGCSVVYDMRFDNRIRDLWLRLGDLSKLARPVRGRVEDSVLDGDGSFYRPLRDTLVDLTAGTAVGRSSRLDLSLTGTLLDARRSRRHQDLGPAIFETRNRARFRFRHLPMPAALHLDGDQLSDFWASDQRPRAVEQLAYAARSTSSFPGAFEPATVGYAASSVAPTQRSGIPANHFGVYSESRPALDGAIDRDYVIDGGVLDNIPVAWAIRTIAAAPASAPVDRWLVYLQPLRFGEPVRREAAGEEPGARETVERARDLRSGTETLSDDIDELERLRSDSLRRSGFAQVLEYALGQVPADEDKPEFLDKLFERALAGAAAYRERLNDIEKDRLRQLWTDPVAVLGVDVLGFGYLSRINDDDQSKADRSALLRDLRDTTFEGVLGDDDVPGPTATQLDAAERREALCTLGRRLRTPQHLGRAVALLIDSARGLGDAGLAVKGSLYELRSRIELLVACHDRYLAAEPTSGGEVANALVRRAARRLAEQPSCLPDWDLDPSDSSSWPDGAFDELLESLVAQAQVLAAAAVDHAEEVEERPASGTADIGHGRALISCLLLAAKDATNAGAATQAVLVAVELLCGPLRPDPLAESGPIRFHMLSAANQSPLEELRPEQRDLSVDEKLAGNQAANFGAFLSAKWRANDWTWGRLDAAVSLVEIVVSRAQKDPAVADRLRAVAGSGPEASVEEVSRRVTARLHRQILREELPLVSRLDVGPPSRELLREAANATAALGSSDVLNTRPLLAVGAESVTGLVVRNPSLWPVLSELGLVAGQAWGADSAKAGWETVKGKARETTNWFDEKAWGLRDKLRQRLGS